jgi:hypothetical protein
MAGPSVWGPHGWKFIHYTTLGYPENPTNNEKKNYKKFYELIKYTIPCFLCRENYINHLKKFPLNDKVLSNRDNLIKWGIDMHNAVNYLHNKKIIPLNDAKDLIIQNNEYCSSINSMDYKLLLLLPIVIIFLMMLNNLIKK